MFGGVVQLAANGNGADGTGGGGATAAATPAPAKSSAHDAAEARKWGTPSTGVRNENWNVFENFMGRAWNPDAIPLHIYNLMRKTDETIIAAMEFTRLAVINKIGEYSNPDEERQEYVRANLNRLGGWKKKAGEFLSTGNWAGSSVTEIVWDFVESFRAVMDVEGPVKEKPDFKSDPKPKQKSTKVVEFGSSWVLHDLQTLRPQTVTYEMHLDHGINHGTVKEVVQNLWSGMEVRLKRSEVIHYVHRGEGGNPYGESRLKAVYIRWAYKEILEKAWARALERYASPILVGETERMNAEVVDPNTGARTTRGMAMLRVLEDLADNSVIVKEPDQLIEMLTAGGKAVGADFLAAIEYLNRAILRGLLFPSLIFDNTDVGSYSLGEGHQDILSMGLEELVGDVQEVLVDQLVRPLLFHKYGAQEDYGCFSAVKIKPEDLKLWSEIVTGLTGVNVLDMSYLGDLNATRSKFGYEEVDEPFKRETPPGYDEDGNPKPVPGFDPVTGKPLPGTGGGAAPGQQPEQPGKPMPPGAKPQPPNPRKSRARLNVAEQLYERELYMDLMAQVEDAGR
jgi:hypothetical protein